MSIELIRERSVLREDGDVLDLPERIDVVAWRYDEISTCAIAGLAKDVDGEITAYVGFLYIGDDVGRDAYQDQGLLSKELCGVAGRLGPECRGSTPSLRIGVGGGQIGWDSRSARFVNQRQEPIQTLFKLYPWEWLLDDEFGGYALATYRQVQWMEPIWKMAAR